MDNSEIDRNKVIRFYPRDDYQLRYFHKLLGNVKGKKILEYGCQTSGVTPLARKGAIITGIDISEEHIKKLNQAIKDEKLTNAKALVMDAENTAFKQETFDIICGLGVIHHLNIEKAMKEIKRILKQDGKAIFIEPLGYNPLIKQYRSKTPELRDPNEHPLISEDFKIMKKYFKIKIRYFYLVATASYFFRTIIRSNFLFRASLAVLYRLDEIFLTLFPFLKKYCWSCVIKLEK